MSEIIVQTEFTEVVNLIKKSRFRALQAVNSELVNLYWQIGQIVSARVASGFWGERTVDELAAFINEKMPELKGFTRRGLYRMKQFYETYAPESECYKVWLQAWQNKDSEIVSPPLTQFQTEQSQQDTIVSAVPTQLQMPNPFLTEVLTKIT